MLYAVLSRSESFPEQTFTRVCDANQHSSAPSHLRDFLAAAQQRRLPSLHRRKESSARCMHCPLSALWILPLAQRSSCRAERPHSDCPLPSWHGFTADDGSELAQPHSLPEQSPLFLRAILPWACAWIRAMVPCGTVYGRYGTLQYSMVPCGSVRSFTGLSGDGTVCCAQQLKLLLLLHVKLELLLEWARRKPYSWCSSMGSRPRVATH